MGFRPAPRSGLATKGVRELERASHQSLLPALPSPEAARWSDSITHKLSGTARTRSTNYLRTAFRFSCLSIHPGEWFSHMRAWTRRVCGLHWPLFGLLRPRLPTNHSLKGISYGHHDFGLHGALLKALTQPILGRLRQLYSATLVVPSCARNFGSLVFCRSRAATSCKGDLS
jgi:hypothetical protein